MKCVADITYDPDQNLAFDLYLPDSLKADACVVFIHGGGFLKGGRGDPEAAHFAARLTKAGFALASVDHRMDTPLESFPEGDRDKITAFMTRSRNVGLTLPPSLYGPAFMAAMEDVSRAIEYLWVEGEQLGVKSRKIGVLGISSGGIVGMALAYPPMNWNWRISRPEAVVSISGACVHPWRIEPQGPPCLMLHGTEDRVIGLENPAFVAKRAEGGRAPISLVETGVRGHLTQIDVALDGKDADGRGYMDMILYHFEGLKDVEDDDKVV